ncbi:MAG: hypothetical protein AAGD14_03860 [Planctomycetota bacterium]
MRRGFLLYEVLVATAILVILATGITVNHKHQLDTVRASYRELVATRAAASRLESGAPERGERSLPIALPGASMRERIVEREPGLLEWEVVVRDDCGETLARLVTRRLVP